MRNNLITLSLVVVAALIGAGVGHRIGVNSTRAVMSAEHEKVRKEASEDLRKLMEGSVREGRAYAEHLVAQCQLRDARAGKCFIPCAIREDCIAKNGSWRH